MQNQSKKALLIVDVQNDFCTGGSLAVPEGDAVIPLANQLHSYFDYVIVTQDWHPADHKSFASNHSGRKVGDIIAINGINQVLWPDHCVQHTKGAELHPNLSLKKIDHLVQKGIDKEIDSYSAFFDNQHLRSTGLGDYLKQKNIHDIYVMGLATDYCVKFSCLDAIGLQLNVYLIEDACRGVELQKGDTAAAIQSLRDAGVKIVKSNDILMQ